MRILYLHSTEPLSLFAESCLTLTPKVSLCGLCHLYLDIEPTLKHFGSEENLLQKFEELTELFQIRSKRRVLTDRPEWAQALLGNNENLLDRGASASALNLLGIDRLLSLGDPLVLESESTPRSHLIRFLKKVGIYSIGDFLALPIETIHHRFGKMGEVLHAWAKGSRTLCLPFFQCEDPLYEKLETDEVSSLESLLFLLKQTLTRMEIRLQARSLAARALHFVFHFESDPSVTKVFSLTEPAREAQTLLRLLRDYLAHFHWESPLTQIELSLRDTVPHLPGQLSLLENSENQFYDLAFFVSRLRNQLGEKNVGFAALQQSHLPEKSYALTWPPAKHEARRDAFPKRPLFIFNPPKPFHPTQEWNLSLTEKLNVEWWEWGGSRDYFRAERGSESLWVYRETQQGAWFIHGTFD
jgi:hypothetical protein